VDDESIEEVSNILKISRDEIRSLVSFYHFIHQEKTGKYRIYVCTNIPCLLKGADKLISDIKNFLDIEIGETTPDGLFSVFETECIGQCDSAPAIIINDKIYRNLSREKIKKIIDRIKKNEES
jgi:NADH:ubiquinone oxidoreductase subunit E